MAVVLIVRQQFNFLLRWPTVVSARLPPRFAGRVDSRRRSRPRRTCSRSQGSPSSATWSASADPGDCCACARFPLSTRRPRSTAPRETAASPTAHRRNCLVVGGDVVVAVAVAAAAAVA